MGVELGATGVTSPRSIMESLGGEVMQRFDALNTANNQEIILSDGATLALFVSKSITRVHVGSM